MLKLLQHAPRGKTLCALLALLTRRASIIGGEPQINDVRAPLLDSNRSSRATYRRARLFSTFRSFPSPTCHLHAPWTHRQPSPPLVPVLIWQLLLKCFSKLTRTLGATMATTPLDLPPILFALHGFYAANPSSPAVGAADAMLKELVTHCGKALLDSLDARVPSSSPLAERMHRMLGLTVEALAPPPPPAALPPPPKAAPPPALSHATRGPVSPSASAAASPPQQPAEGTAPASDGAVTCVTSDDAVSAALARLQEMKKRYNIQMTAAASSGGAGAQPTPAGAVAPPTPAAASAPIVAASPAPVVAASPAPAAAASPPPSESPGQDVQAIRSRLARLKAVPRA